MRDLSSLGSAACKRPWATWGGGVLSLLLASGALGCSNTVGTPGSSALPGTAGTGAVDPVTGQPIGMGAGGNAGDGSLGASGAGVVPGVAPDPGTVALRRLNRAEYNNTVADLLGTQLDIAADFPPDDLIFGFDTVGQALTVSPLHAELYEKGAARLVAELFSRDAADPARAAVLVCDYNADAACAGQILNTFASRAFRRPVLAEELTRYTTLIDTVVADAGTVEEGLRLALQAMLMAPQFLYRVEGGPVTAPEPLNGYALASRLSYFLWSRMPDAPLTQLASTNALQDPATLASEAERLLADPRSQAFIENFAGQWLQTRLLEGEERDPNLFPGYSEELSQAMREETTLYFTKFLRDGLPVRQLVTAPFGFVNTELAAHYGIDAPATEGMTEVSLAGTERLGLLTQGSFLTVTSHPNKTSPVKRGKWVLEQLLCASPPPPPPGVEANLEGEMTEGLSLREKLALHRTEPSCAVCHASMDPIGLAFENYDATGAYRTMDGTVAIDPAGELPGAGLFADALELAALLAADDRFDRCVTRQLAVYGLGRGFAGASDNALLDQMEASMVANGGTLGAAIAAIIANPAFTMRGVVGGTP